MFTSNVIVEYAFIGNIVFVRGVASVMGIDTFAWVSIGVIVMFVATSYVPGGRLRRPVFIR
jgi:hydrogenase maturation factor